MIYIGKVGKLVLPRTSCSVRHMAIEVIEHASEDGIVMPVATFPPHTSNKLQSIDFRVYGPFKTFYNQCLDAQYLNNA
jgi:hypothetical protein